MGKASRKKKEVAIDNRTAKQPLETKTAEKPAALPHKKGFINNPWVHCLAVVILGIVIYSNTFKSPFILDDWTIIKSPYVIDLKTVFAQKDSPFMNDKFIAFLSRPVAILSFVLNYKLHHYEVAGFHAFNLIIHLATALLVYYFVVLTFRTAVLRDSSYSSQRNFIALFTSLLFVAHPIQTQAVTYIAQRFASLASFFYLLSVVMFIRFRLSLESNKTPIFRGRRVLWYAGSIVSAILAYKTKEIAYTLPFALMLYEYIFFRAEWKKRAMFLVPMMLTLLVFPLTLILIKAYSTTDAGALYIGLRAPGEYKTLPRLHYLFTEFVAIAAYLRLLVLPIKQTVLHEFTIYNSLFDATVFLSFLFLSAVIAAGIWLIRAQKTSIEKRHHLIIAFGIFWFFLTLSIESSIFPLYPIYEHRLYLPSLGLFFAASTAFAALTARIKPSAQKIAASVMVAVILIYGGAAYARNIIYKDSKVFWEDVKSKNKSNRVTLVLLNVGIAYLREQKFEDALREFESALQIDPRNEDLYNAVAVTYLGMNRFDDAIRVFKMALSINPSMPEARLGLGDAYLKKGIIPAAIEELLIAKKDFPSYYQAYHLLGYAYINSGRIDEAISEFREAIRLFPKEPVVHFNLGLAYGLKKQYDEAIKSYSEAIRLKPDYVEAYNNIGAAYANQKRFDEAVQAFRTALAYRPGHAEAERNLKEVLRQKQASK